MLRKQELKLFSASGDTRENNDGILQEHNNDKVNAKVIGLGRKTYHTNVCLTRRSSSVSRFLASCQLFQLLSDRHTFPASVSHVGGYAKRVGPI